LAEENIARRRCATPPMKSFAKEFLRDELPDQRQIFLGAFGKHPGWDDHIDDIGLETESLVTARQLLYVEGIGGQIGAWEKLEGGAQIPFRHVFVWQREAQTLVGRMWASSDGKRRTRYPMVVCAHCVGIGLELVLDTLLAWLEELQMRAIATESANDIRAMIPQFRDGLREWLRTTDEMPANQPFDAETFFNEIDFATEEERLVKSLWQLHESQFAAGKYKSRARSPEHFRVLASSASTGRSIHFWHRVIASQLDPAAPVLLAVPVDQYWMDLLAGEPTPGDLFCLRASPRAVSVTSDTIGDPPDSFREGARAMLEQIASGEQTVVAGRDASWMTRLFGR
jgi:hypothetical protein